MQNIKKEERDSRSDTLIGGIPFEGTKDYDILKQGLDKRGTAVGSEQGDVHLQSEVQ
jgi:hypothetical protein